MQKDKIETLIGFMIKAGKVVYGKDTLESYKKKIFLIVMCKSTTQNTQKSVLNIAKARRVPILITKKPLEQIVFKQNCKVIAITEHQASKAIIENTNENYELIDLAEVIN